MYPVESSLIAAYDYDREREQLTIQFRKGGIYYYANVPEHVVHQFRESASKGKFFLAHIKGAYDFEKG